MMPAERDSDNLGFIQKGNEIIYNSPKAASASRTALAVFVLRNRNDKKKIFE